MAENIVKLLFYNKQFSLYQYFSTSGNNPHFTFMVWRKKLYYFCRMATSNSVLTFNLLGQHLLLLPQKAIYWQQQNALIVADVHLGKVGHFRKAGIAVPRDMEQDDLAVLSDLVEEYHACRIYFLGDLFHSDKNADWDWFVLWRKHFPKLELVLVKGNHDIINDSNYIDLDVQLYQQLMVGPFLMVHEPLTETDLQKCKGYVFCGHIHPGVNLSGRARQHLTLPCFAFGARLGILPSFGKFTGSAAIRREQYEYIFAVLQNKVIAVG